MTLPIPFKEFSKDPVKGILFITLVAVGYLYVDNKMNYQGQIEMCYSKTMQLEKKVDTGINSPLNQASDQAGPFRTSRTQGFEATRIDDRFQDPEIQAPGIQAPGIESS